MSDDLDELKERNELLHSIQKAEDEASWTSLEELKERSELVHSIQLAEDSAEWTDLDELRLREGFLTRIAELEETEAMISLPCKIQGIMKA